MKKLKLPPTSIGKKSMLLVIKLVISVLVSAIPAIINNVSDMQLHMWILTVLQIGTILLMITYVFSPKMSEKVVFRIAIYSSILLILLTRVVFPPEMSLPICKYASQIVCVAAICCLVELDRYIESYKTFKCLYWAIIVLLLASSLLETFTLKKMAEYGATCISGLWMMFLTVLCVLITYKASIKYRMEQQK